MCLESQKGSPSYNDLATRFETVYQTSPSKQAISKKINPACVQFFQSVLALILLSRLPKAQLDFIKNGNTLYKRILVQDSTIIKLPQRLFKIFSGVSNGHTAVCNARIQGVYDLLSGSFISFSIDTYTKNDVVSASELELCRGDLALRDRGYFKNSEIPRHIEAGADFIFRYKHKTLIFDPSTNQQINLLDLLKKNKSIDMEVCLSDYPKVKVRIVASPVSEQIANSRRRKAKLDYKRYPLSAENLELMGWTIFLTSIPKEQADCHKILMIYGLRWRIEIIFKTWKSHMQFAKVHNVSENHLRIMIIARFIMIVICMQIIYIICYQRVLSKFNRHISLFKLMGYLMKNPEKITEILYSNINLGYALRSTDDVLRKYCTYDQRKRLNFNQLAMMSFLS